MGAGLENFLASVHPSVRLSHPAAARRCCRFAAVGPSARRYRSTAAAAQGRSRRSGRSGHGLTTFSATNFF